MLSDKVHIIISFFSTFCYHVFDVGLDVGLHVFVAGLHVFVVGLHVGLHVFVVGLHVYFGVGLDSHVVNVFAIVYVSLIRLVLLCVGLDSQVVNVFAIVYVSLIRLVLL
jgi:hypothetical protein